MEGKKILIFGKNGQVGHELVERLNTKNDVHAFDQDTDDFTLPFQVAMRVKHIKPDIVINAAAYTAVDKAETEKYDVLYLINATTPHYLSLAAQSVGAQFIHYSTDYVFDGTKAEPYTEKDDINPINAYGRSKAIGDAEVQNGNYLILRTSWVYGNRGSNFLNKMLELFKKEGPLRIIDDQAGNQTPSSLIADITIKCLEQRLPEVNPGVYNMTTTGGTTWYDFARKILDIRNANYEPIKKEIIPVSSSEYETPAKRPNNSKLCCKKIEGALGIKLPHWEEALEQVFKERMFQETCDYLNETIKDSDSGITANGIWYGRNPKSGLLEPLIHRGRPN
jgi:dTDP-4-dehydrorhamnose reductase